jgi:hypothetical protein
MKGLRAYWLAVLMMCVLVVAGCGGGGSSSSSSSSSSPAATNPTDSTLKLDGTWNYAGNSVASDGNIESHSGKATVTQNANNVATFNLVGTWNSSKTGNTGADNIPFTSNVTSSGLTIISFDLTCHDPSNNSCLCTVSGSGNGSASALTVDIKTTSKTCGTPFTATAKFAFTK